MQKPTQKKQQHKIITLAQVCAPHGVHGFLKLQVFTEDPKAISNYQNLQIQLKDDWQPLSKYELKQVGENYQIRIDAVHDRDQAKKFTNALIGVLRTDLPALSEKDEFYWTDLEGLSVINQQGKLLGKVDHLFETGANDVMKIMGAKSYLIPFIKQYVISVDLIKQEIVVDWDEDFV